MIPFLKLRGEYDYMAERNLIILLDNAAYYHTLYSTSIYRLI